MCMPPQVGWRESWKTSQRKWYLGLSGQEGEWLAREEHSKQKAQCSCLCKGP